MSLITKLETPLNAKLTGGVAWGLAIAAICLVAVILLFAIRRSDPAAQGPAVGAPFNPAAERSPAAIRQMNEALARFDRSGGIHDAKKIPHLPVSHIYRSPTRPRQLTPARP
jgi:hypothetical protein